MDKLKNIGDERERLLVYKYIADSTRTALLVTDLGNYILYANKSFLRVFGEKYYYNVIGKNIKEVFPDDFFRQFSPTDSNSLEKKSEIYAEFEVSIDLEGNRQFDFQCLPLCDQQNKIIGKLFSFIDITTRKEAEVKLRYARDQLRKFAGYLEDAQELERKKIAREIHDEFGQIMSVINLNLDFIKKSIKVMDFDVESEIDSLQEMVANGVDRMRQVIKHVRPYAVEEMGLIDALKDLATDFTENFKINCEFNSNVAELHFEEKQELATYRIVQEALTNISRHSKAKLAKVNIFADHEKVEISIIDDGKGFDKTALEGQDNFGIIGMKERAMICAGDLIINTLENKGTQVILIIPLKKND